MPSLSRDENTIKEVNYCDTCSIPSVPYRDPLTVNLEKEYEMAKKKAESKKKATPKKEAKKEASNTGWANYRIVEYND